MTSIPQEILDEQVNKADNSFRFSRDRTSVGLKLLTAQYVMAIVLSSVDFLLQNNKILLTTEVNKILDRELSGTLSIKRIIETIKQQLIFNGKYIDDIPTPWEIELGKESESDLEEAKILQTILGPSKSSLRVFVVDNKTNNIYSHNFTEDLMFGMLSVVQNIKDSTGLPNKFSFYFEDVINNPLVGTALPITFDDLSENYISSTFRKKFRAELPIGSVNFQTTDVIRGIITMCDWLNLNPHEYISNIQDKSLGRMLVTF